MGIFGRFFKAITRRIQGYSGVGFFGDFDAVDYINAVIIRRISPIAFADFYITDKDGNDTDHLQKEFLDENFLQIYLQMTAQALKEGYAVCLIDRSYSTPKLNMPDDIEVFIQNNRVIKAKYAGNEYGSEDIIVLYDLWFQIFKKSREKSCATDRKILGAVKSARYTTARYRGALGMLTRDDDKQSANAELFKEESDKILDDYKKTYGITEGQSQVIITHQKLRWQSMAQNVSTLGLVESRKECVEGICMIFEIKPELLLGGATFANSESAELSVLISLIIPNAKKDMQVFKKQLKLKGAPKLDFSENPLIKKYNAEWDKEKIRLIQQLFKDNVISSIEYREQVQNFIDL